MARRNSSYISKLMELVKSQKGGSVDEAASPTGEPKFLSEPRTLAYNDHDKEFAEYLEYLHNKHNSIQKCLYDIADLIKGKVVPMNPTPAKHKTLGDGHWITMRGHHMFIPNNPDGSPGRVTMDVEDKKASGHLIGEKISADDHNRMKMNLGLVPRKALRTKEDKVKSDENKLVEVRELAKKLKTVKSDVKKDLKGDDHSPARVRAAVLAVMLEANLRVGNEDSAKYGNLGATTLTKKSIRVNGNNVRLIFKGKSNTPWDTTIKDGDLAATMKYFCDAVDDKEPVFQTRQSNGSLKPITAAKVGEAVKAYGFHPKSIRTYKASEMAFEALRESFSKAKPAKSKKEISERMEKALAPVAKKMGHDYKMLIASYVAPAMLEDFRDNLGVFKMSKPDFTVGKHPLEPWQAAQEKIKEQKAKEKARAKSKKNKDKK